MVPLNDREPPFAAPEFLQNLRRSGVLPGNQCDEVEAKVAGGEYPGDPRGLAEALVRAAVLTEYQARRIAEGHRTAWSSAAT